MEPFTSEELEGYSHSSLKSLAIELSRNLKVAETLIKKLETRLQNSLMELSAKNQRLLFEAEKLNNMKDLLFGPSSESRDTTPLFGDPVDDTPPKPSSQSRKKRKKTEERLSPNVPVHEIEHKIDPEIMDKLNLAEWPGQFETSDLISVVPSKIILERHKRQKYFHIDSESGEKSIVSAPGPCKLREGNRYSLEFAVECGLAKYHWHLPLERQVRMMACQGLEIGSQTIFNQIDLVAFHLAPTVFKRIIEDIHSSRVNEADDTTWKNLEDRKTKTHQKYYLWGVKNQRAVCFNIYNSRSQKVAKDFLGNLKGVLVTDGHNSFKSLANADLILANDWSHARRKFFKAAKTSPEDANPFLDLIDELFKIESEIKDEPPDKRLEIRQSKSKLIIQKIQDLLNETVALPESNLGKALSYTSKLWEGLVVFLNDPEVPMHTNGIERAIRGPAVGRKNHYGSKNFASAKTAAIWYSIVETCKLCDISPREYLILTLQAIMTKQPYKMPWEFQIKEAPSR